MMHADVVKKRRDACKGKETKAGLYPEKKSAFRLRAFKRGASVCGMQDERLMQRDQMRLDKMRFVSLIKPKTSTIR